MWFPKHEDEAFSLLSDLVGSGSNRIMTSVNLEQEYGTLGGRTLTRKKAIECILVEYNNDMLLKSSSGCANLLIFNSIANEKHHIQDLDNEDKVHVCCKIHCYRFQGN